MLPTCAEDTNAHVQFFSTWLNTLMKMVSNLSAVVKTLFFHSTWRYLLNTCRQDIYYECDWNSGRTIVIVEQTKNDLSGK